MRFKTKDLVMASALLALGIVLPLVVHMTGINGVMFLPMHIPVLIGGLMIGPYSGLIIGILSPILNHFLTGMPPVPTLWMMLVELPIYGLVSAYLYRKVKMTLLPSLILSMIMGRIGSAAMALFLAKGLGFPMPPMGVYVKGITLMALPGIAIQIILIPIIVRAYEKSQNPSGW